ncbi:hypothetical protein [Agilicoccus flavus]|uniref:hypothetical protein n=1 Tax=Agilicoccus flavus TaxID=2775968 RepID=UPI001CF69F74|nr:hypothetical protein [Agilicoccus flavus]
MTTSLGIRPPLAVTGLRRALCVGAVAACLPYLALKVHWLLGGRIGLLDPAFGRSTTMAVANALTFAMEVVALVLAVAFVAPWGRRLPGPVVLLPMWVGTGLLGGILVSVPLQLLATLVVAARPSSPAAPGGPSGTPPIADWVYAVVYAGFGVLGLCLIGGFALYAHQRWLRPGGWARPLRAWVRPAPAAAAIRAVGGLAVAFGVAVAALGFVGDPRGVGGALGDGAVAVAGGLGLLALWAARPANLAGVVPAAAAWLGSGALAAWGLYRFVLLAVPNDLAGDAPADPARLLLEAARCALGCALAAGLWAARPTPRTTPPMEGPS